MGKSLIHAALVALTFLASPVMAEEPGRRLSLADLRAAYGTADSRYLTIGGVEVHYRDEGRGPALLMVHGSTSSLRTYDRIAARLKDRYRIIRFDIPPQGLSGPVSDEAASRLQPTDIPEQLLNHLGIKEVTAIGVSSGGTMAAFLAAKRPDLVKRLVLSNMPSDPVETAQLVQPQKFLDAQQRVKETGLQDEIFWDAFMDYFSGVPARISPALRQEYFDMNRRVPEKNLIKLVARVADNAVTSQLLGSITQPVLLIWGTADPLLPAAAADRLAFYLKAAPISRVLLPDVGHYPPLEVPDRFADITVTYLEQVLGSPNKQ